MPKFFESVREEVQTIDGYHDVPVADVTTNTVMRDVIGNKTDVANETTDEASIVALFRQTLADLDTINALFLPRKVTKTVTFDGGAGSGAVGTVNLFTITGGVDISLKAFCDTNLTEAGATATIEIGISGNTAYIIATTNAVDIDADEVWKGAGPTSAIELTSDASKEVTIKEANIIATIGAQNVTAGVIDFVIIYVPNTSDGLVEAA